MVMVVIGVGVMAMLQLLAAGSVQNDDAARTTTAMTLASNIRELSMGLAFFDPNQPADEPHTWASKEADVTVYDNIMDLDGAAFNPPLNARRQALTGYPSWTQGVEVESVSEENVTVVVPDTTTQPMARVTVTIRRHGMPVYRTSWLASAPKAN